MRKVYEVWNRVNNIDTLVKWFVVKLHAEKFLDKISKSNPSIYYIKETTLEEHFNRYK